MKKLFISLAIAGVIIGNGISYAQVADIGRPGDVFALVTPVATPGAIEPPVVIGTPAPADQPRLTIADIDAQIAQLTNERTSLSNLSSNLSLTIDSLSPGYFRTFLETLKTQVDNRWASIPIILDALDQLRFELQNPNNGFELGMSG